MSTTTMPERQQTLFATEDNQSVHEIGEDEGADVFIVGNLVVTEAKITKRRGRWELRGTIPLKLVDRR